MGDVLRRHKLKPFFYNQANKYGLPFSINSFIAIFDQCLISVVTFGTFILLARFLSPEEYGLFVLAYTILLFLNGIQTSLVTNPMMVQNASMDEARVRQYFTTTGIYQLFISLITVFITILIYILCNHYLSKYDYLSLATSLAFSVFAFQSQEFVRRVLFSRMKFKRGIINDLVSYLLQILGIIGLVVIKKISTANAFYVIAISSAIAALLGIYQCREFITLKLTHFKSDIKNNWNQGKWLLSSNLALWTSGQSYYLITAFLLGPKGPAILKACQNIVAPTHILLFSLENMIPSTAAKMLSENGREAFDGFLRKSKNTVLILIIPYLIIVSLFPGIFLKLFYNDKYKGYGIVIVLISIRYLFNTLGSIKIIGLRGLNKVKPIFLAHIFASLLTIILSIILVKYLGVTGAAIGGVLSSITIYSTVRHYYIAYLESYRDKRSGELQK